ncbi:GNAT family N-acetyltransferase [Corynebacterium tuscaniense]|uniref:GNAT family N-acetyltransferase n=1 Tax=Corynebacterium tuscaniense TaxID=302449 RepID=UPI00123C4695|nr:GNAT family protein [Corynebacterium tuscaniense]KAA8741703.1 GNAT family N-acetyltransferase [Corynebacterium tuscaniense]
MKVVPWDQVAQIPHVEEDILKSVTDEQTVRFTHVPDPYTEDHLREFLAAPPTGVRRYAIVLDERYAGNVELRSMSDDVANLGYTTAPWARGRGIMTQAVRIVTQGAHEEGVHRVELRAAVHNHASRRVAQRAGFTFEGISRHAELLRGTYNDVALYSHLATDSN